MTKEINPRVAVIVIAFAVAVVAAFGASAWMNGGKEKGMNLGEAMAVDRQRAAERGEKPPAVDPKAPRPKMMDLSKILNKNPGSKKDPAPKK